MGCLEWFLFFHTSFHLLTIRILTGAAYGLNYVFYSNKTTRNTYYAGSKIQRKKKHVNLTIDRLITKISKPSLIQKKKVNEFVILVTYNIKTVLYPANS